MAANERRNQDLLKKGENESKLYHQHEMSLAE